MNAPPSFPPGDFDDFDPCPWCGSRHPDWYMCREEYDARRPAADFDPGPEPPWVAEEIALLVAETVAGVAGRLARPSRN